MTNSLTRNLILTGLTLLTLNACTGIGPIDDLLDPPKSETRNITFHNAGSEPLDLQLTWGDIVSDNRCEPYAGNRQLKVNAGEVANLSMTKKCHYGGYFDVSVNLLPSVSFATIDFTDAAAAALLKPGVQVVLSSDDLSTRTTLAILDDNIAGQRGGAWRLFEPSNDGFPEWKLAFEVPASLMGRTLLIGFPASLGITSLNHEPLRLVNGVYYGDARTADGLSIQPNIESDRTITCSEASCHVE